MICEQFREAVSARLDGEDPGLPTAMLDAHLDACAACTAWATAAADVTRETRLAPAGVVPDRTGAILAAAADRGLLGGDAAVGELRWRWVLAALALMQLAVAVPGLLLGDDAGAPTHIAHELGSWDVALAVGFLFAAWRPSRAWGMVPLVAALVGCLLVTTGVDVYEGHAALAHEAAHILEVAGLGVLWLLAHRPNTTPRTPRLRLA
jgi:predicted anti-sigma-YlaC factor YlaD